MTKPNQEKIFVDTSAWIALFIENDARHKEAKSIYEKINQKGKRLYTSDYVIDETITFALKKGGFETSCRIGNALLSSHLIQIEFIHPDLFHASWKAYLKYSDKQFSFTDVTSFILMSHQKIFYAFSFDQHFRQAGFDILQN